ncbi:FtsK/SpoIIIE domain-containing protein [Metabacillus sp. cB07]|uniref:FtsK/SpoIIIE domain-containing protein n=1 Tax=Metabacillus sp. cB07 TaxID=2806989 RepID=UPI0019399DEE|nr:FtsK/SpoIIIE domain-containing protein [Metabacillus sp. cB07]
MFIEIASSAAMGSFLLYLKFKNENANNDAEKFQRIAANSGLKIKEGTQTRTIQLLRKTKKAWGTELAYRIPLGLSLDDFEKEKSRFQDGLNNKRGELEFNFKKLKNLKLDRTIISQLKKILSKNKGARKEIEFSYDGVLLVKIYNEPLTNKFLYSDVDRCIGWEVPVGISRNGQIKHDFDKKAHIIVAGTTDFGKSNWVNNAIATLIKNNPSEVEFTLIDLKGGLEFSPYNSLKQLKTPVATNEDEALEALQSAVDQMEITMEKLKKKGFKNVKDAGFKKRHFVIIDEAADIADNKECQELLKDIARKGRAAGLRLIYTTQYPTTETISSQVKRNCIGRLCFVLDTSTASGVVLDQGGAEKLPLIQGRALYKDVKLIEVQTPFISDEEIREVIRPQINIRARKGVRVEENAIKGDTGNSDTLVIEQA